MGVIEQARRDAFTQAIGVVEREAIRCERIAEAYPEGHELRDRYAAQAEALRDTLFRLRQLADDNAAPPPGEDFRSLEEALDYISQAKKALGRWYITGRPLPDAITDLIRAHETLQLRVAKWLRQEAARLLHESHVNIRAYNVLCRTADRLEVGEEPQGARTGTARVPGVRPGTAADTAAHAVARVRRASTSSG